MSVEAFGYGAVGGLLVTRTTGETIRGSGTNPYPGAVVPAAAGAAGAVAARRGREVVYTSYAGTDIVAEIVLPGEKPITLGELQTISYSTHRENTPVRFLGHVSPAGFVKGPRTIAGSLIFTVFNYYAFYRIEQFKAAIDAGLYPLADMLPPFDVVITFSNESGSLSKMKLYGITVVDEGQTMSVDDLMTEQTYCTDDMTQALTRTGWKGHEDLTTDDVILTLNPHTKAIEWRPVLAVNRFDYDGELIHWQHSRGIDALTTPNHRWLTTSQYHLERSGFSGAKAEFRTTEELTGTSRSIFVAGGDSEAVFAKESVYSDELVELIGWAVTEGTYFKPPYRAAVSVGQSESANPDAVKRLRYLVAHFAAAGATSTEHRNTQSGRAGTQRNFYFGTGIGELIREAAPNKTLTPEFLCALTQDQAILLYETLMAGDGHRAVIRKQKVRTDYFIQKAGPVVDGLQMLAAMLGRRTNRALKAGVNMTMTTIYHHDFVNGKSFSGERIPYQGIVWCPTTENGTWFARRNGSTYWTGNSYMARGIQPMTGFVAGRTDRALSGRSQGAVIQ